MLRGMTALQFSEWMAFFKLENERREGKADTATPKDNAAVMKAWFAPRVVKAKGK